MVGVTEAVGEEDSESWGDVVPMAIREAGEAPSGAEMSRFISSLLRRDTEGEKQSCITYFVTKKKKILG